MGPGLRLRGARRELAGGARRWRRSGGPKRKKPPRGGLFAFVHPAILAWGGGRYRVRTCDPYHVKVVLYR